MPLLVRESVEAHHGRHDCFEQLPFSTDPRRRGRLRGVDQSQHAVTLGNQGRESVPRRVTRRRTDEHWLHRTSSALKHFLDTLYYPVMDDTDGRRYAAFVHGNSDTGGAVRAIESITKGMGWKRVRESVSVIGEPSRTDLDACWELGAVVAASLTM